MMLVKGTRNKVVLQMPSLMFSNGFVVETLVLSSNFRIVTSKLRDSSERTMPYCKPVDRIPKRF
jgi:hypothetical protein